MKSRRMMVGFALTAALMIPLAACSSGGKMRLSASNMCKSAGGTYNTSDQTCDAPPVNKKKAAAMCDAHGGVYMADLQVCEIEGSK